MLRGLYTSALGMTTQMNRMDVISNNIANVNTNAYKKDKVITQSFTEELMKHLKDETDDTSKLTVFTGTSIGKYSLGLFVDDIKVDFSSGSLKTTGGAFDLAINGDGFFTLNYEGEERYTRDGAFTLNGARELVTKDGIYVTGQNGNIQVPDGNVAISAEGMIYVGGEYIDTIKMVSFEDKSLLRKQGSNMYSVLDGAGPTDFTGTVEQGALELSNVNSVKEMVEMIEITRAYEANQRMVTTIDSTLQRAVNDIGKK